MCARAYSNTSVYMHLCTHTERCVHQQKEQATERLRKSLCVNMPVAPKGQPALLRFNSLSHCHCSEVNVHFLLKIKSRGARNPPDSSFSHINGKFSLKQ